MYNIHLLPASFGDSILIEYGKEEPSYILIDGGPYFAFSNMMSALKKVAPAIKEIELLVITHIDIDHIDGTICLLNQDNLPFTIKEVWFNGYKEISKVTADTLAALQGEYLSNLIAAKKIPHNQKFGNKAVVVDNYSKLPVITLDGGMKLTLLSPGKKELVKLTAKWEEELNLIGDEQAIKEKWSTDTRYKKQVNDVLGSDDEEKDLSMEALQNLKPAGDTSVANLSSIAFIGEYDGKKCLFAGDATSDALLNAIEPMVPGETERLKLDAWKLAHHGSRKSNLAKIMRKIDSKLFLISSDGKRYEHPDRSCIAKLLLYNKRPDKVFYFNYLTDFNSKWKDDELKAEYKYEAEYGNESSGITVKL
jgi:beta-lactamase superfamily II metal-dependent hydrolase